MSLNTHPSSSNNTINTNQKKTPLQISNNSQKQNVLSPPSSSAFVNMTKSYKHCHRHDHHHHDHHTSSSSLLLSPTSSSSKSTSHNRHKEKKRKEKLFVNLDLFYSHNDEISFEELRAKTLGLLSEKGELIAVVDHDDSNNDRDHDRNDNIMRTVEFNKRSINGIILVYYFVRM